ncbi:Glutamine synthetase 2 [Microbacterium sp. Bi128]|nr:Glutamine synthetase 2 [Microbacterium sp. Bi128]
MTFRTVIKEVALQQGTYATFMPKPFTAHPGSGMHTHFSLFEGDTNAFYEAGSEFQLSETARQFIAGILKHAPEFTAVTNQFVNSYKRLWGGGEAPSYLSWGHNNRSALVRVPLYKPGKGQSARIEYRGIDSAANPYLAYAVLLGAGLKGIEEGYQLPAAGCATSNSPSSCCSSCTASRMNPCAAGTPRRPSPRSPPAGISAVPTPRSSTATTATCGCSNTGSSCSSCAGRTSCR